MIHILFTLEVPRRKVNEMLEFFGKKLFSQNQEDIAKVGGKFLGIWSTVWGNMNEITLLVAFPNEEAYGRVWELPQAEEYKKALAKWHELSPKATTKVMRPASFSPLQ